MKKCSFKLSSHLHVMLLTSSAPLLPPPSPPPPSPLATTEQPTEELDLELRLAPLGLHTPSGNTRPTKPKRTRITPRPVDNLDLQLAPPGTAIAPSNNEVPPHSTRVIKRKPVETFESEQQGSRIQNRPRTYLLASYTRTSAVAPVNQIVGRRTLGREGVGMHDDTQKTIN